MDAFLFYFGVLNGILSLFNAFMFVVNYKFYSSRVKIAVSAAVFFGAYIACRDTGIADWIRR